MPSEARLTAKKRAAWKCAGRSPGSKVQCRFQKKLLVTATTKAPTAAATWWMPRTLGQEREDGEVDQVAGAADEAEFEQLHPVRRLPGGSADPVGEFGGRGHRERIRLTRAGAGTAIRVVFPLRWARGTATLAAVALAAAAVALALVFGGKKTPERRQGRGRRPRRARRSKSSPPATAPARPATRPWSRSRSRTSSSRRSSFGGEPQLGEGHLRFSLNRVPDCVDPKKLQDAINSPVGKGRLVGASFDYAALRGPQRRPRRADRLRRQLLPRHPAGDLLPRPSARASTA